MRSKPTLDVKTRSHLLTTQDPSWSIYAEASAVETGNKGSSARQDYRAFEECRACSGLWRSPCYAFLFSGVSTPYRRFSLGMLGFHFALALVKAGRIVLVAEMCRRKRLWTSGSWPAADRKSGRLCTRSKEAAVVVHDGLPSSRRSRLVLDYAPEMLLIGGRDRRTCMTTTGPCLIPATGTCYCCMQRLTVVLLEGVPCPPIVHGFWGENAHREWHGE